MGWDPVRERNAQEDQGSVSDFLRAGVTGSYELPHRGVTGSGNLTQVICRSSTLFGPLSHLSSPRSSFFKSGCFWRLLPPLSFRALRFVLTKQKKQEKKSALCSVDITLTGQSSQLLSSTFLAKWWQLWPGLITPQGRHVLKYHTVLPHILLIPKTQGERPTSHYHGQIN